MKSEIMGKLSGSPSNEEIKGKIEKKLGKVRSHENLQQFTSNKPTTVTRSPRYHI